MRRINWRIFLAIGLLAASVALYSVQIAFFRRQEDTFFYMLQDLAFVPVQVLLVTLVVNEMMARREKMQLQHKMNMVIGTFFVEIGNDLLAMFARLDLRPADMSRHLHVTRDWTTGSFAQARKSLRQHSFAVHSGPTALLDLKDVLRERRTALMRLLENPNLLDHDTFTDVLWAVCHLAEELEYRPTLDALPDSDMAHLEGDAERAYRALVLEWLSYVAYLKDQYPYMFSLVLRTNPFDAEAKVAVS